MTSYFRNPVTGELEVAKQIQYDEYGLPMTHNIPEAKAQKTRDYIDRHSGSATVRLGSRSKTVRQGGYEIIATTTTKSSTAEGAALNELAYSKLNTSVTYKVMLGGEEITGYERDQVLAEYYVLHPGSRRMSAQSAAQSLVDAGIGATRTQRIMREKGYADTDWTMPVRKDVTTTDAITDTIVTPRISSPLANAPNKPGGAKVDVQSPAVADTIKDILSEMATKQPAAEETTMMSAKTMTGYTPIKLRPR